MELSTAHFELMQIIFTKLLLQIRQDRETVTNDDMPISL